LALSLSGLAAGQDLDRLGRNEVSGTFGHTFVSDQSVPNSGLANSSISHGAGYSFEFSYARILRGSDWGDVAIEIPVTFNPDEDLHYATNQVPRQYSSVFVTPALRFRLFPEVGLSPWVSFGGGFGHFGASSSLLYFGTNTGTRSESGGVLMGGAGLDLHVPPRLERFGVRIVVRDDWTAVPPLNINTGKSRQHNYYVAVGAAYRF
jgi:hypothetical protein